MMIFGTTQDGRTVHAVTIAAGDLTVTLLSFGAILQDVRLAGVAHGLTLGSDRLADYEGPLHYHGALVGPVVNRLTGAQAPIGGVMHRFVPNQDGRHLLHSGDAGTHAKVWDVLEQAPDAVTFGIVLPAGEGGHPGNRTVRARFAVTAPATLKMEVTGSTDAPSLMNFANHGYWNLDGTARWDGHRLRIAADHYLPVTDDVVPTGEIAAVTGTGFDLREGREITAGNPVMDHNFCLSDGRVALRDVLWLRGRSGVAMTIATTEPGVQVYDGRAAGYDGLAVEPQVWPDAPNHPGFPSIDLLPGDELRQVTQWRFERG